VFSLIPKPLMGDCLGHSLALPRNEDLSAQTLTEYLGQIWEFIFGHTMQFSRNMHRPSFLLETSE
jgi:hypothetical protein